MKPVIQEETTGCAIASAAAIAGISYQEAKKAANALGIYASDPMLWSATGYIYKLLNKLDIESENNRMPFTDWDTLPDCALLSIKWHQVNDKSYWHWVVFIREAENSYVLDSKKSLKTNIRTDFGRIKPKWYIKIHQSPLITLQ